MIFRPLIIMFLFVGILVQTAILSSDFNPNITSDNITSKLNWNYSYIVNVNESVSENFKNRYFVKYVRKIDTSRSNRFDNIMYKTFDWLGYCAFEITKYVIEFTFKHPIFPYKFILFIIIIIIFFKPITYFIYFIYVIIKYFFKKQNENNKVS